MSLSVVSHTASVSLDEPTTVNTSYNPLCSRVRSRLNSYGLDDFIHISSRCSGCSVPDEMNTETEVLGVTFRERIMYLSVDLPRLLHTLQSVLLFRL